MANIIPFNPGEGQLGRAFNNPIVQGLGGLIYNQARNVAENLYNDYNQQSDQRRSRRRTYQETEQNFSEPTNTRRNNSMGYSTRRKGYRKSYGKKRGGKNNRPIVAYVPRRVAFPDETDVWLKTVYIQNTLLSANNNYQTVIVTANSIYFPIVLDGTNTSSLPTGYTQYTTLYNKCYVKYAKCTISIYAGTAGVPGHICMAPMISAAPVPLMIQLAEEPGAKYAGIPLDTTGTSANDWRKLTCQASTAKMLGYKSEAIARADPNTNMQTITAAPTAPWYFQYTMNAPSFGNKITNSWQITVMQKVQFYSRNQDFN